MRFHSFAFKTFVDLQVGCGSVAVERTHENIYYFVQEITSLEIKARSLHEPLTHTHTLDRRNRDSRFVSDSGRFWVGTNINYFREPCARYLAALHCKFEIRASSVGESLVYISVGNCANSPLAFAVLAFNCVIVEAFRSHHTTTERNCAVFFHLNLEL